MGCKSIVNKSTDNEKYKDSMDQNDRRSRIEIDTSVSS